MMLTIWGARGSIPVSGPDFVAYGGDTTCAELESSQGEIIILDAGTGLRALGNKLESEGRKVLHFLFSHAHWDHLLGFPFFKPLYRSDVVIYFHGCTYAQESIRTILSETMRAPFFPVDLTEVEATLHFDDDCRQHFTLAGLQCQSIALNHPNGGYGFRLTEAGRSLAWFPDNELDYHHPDGRDFADYAEFVAAVDLMIHDGEYFPEEYQRLHRGWGHSVFTDTVRLALAARVGRLILWHLDQDRSDAAADAMAEAARQAIAEAGQTLPCEVARTGLSLMI